MLGLNVTVSSVSSSLSIVLFARVATKTELSLTMLLTVIAAEPIFASCKDSVAGVVGGVPTVGGVLNANTFDSNTNTLVLAIS